MAEFVGFVAAVPAFIQLTKYCAVFATELYTYSEQRENAKLEIAAYATEANCTSNTIRSSYGLIKRHHELHPRSRVLHYLGPAGTLKEAVDMSKNICTRLKSVTGNLRDQNDTEFGALKYLKWRLRKKAVLEILMQLRAVQGNMVLIVNLVHTEALHSALEAMESMETNRRLNMKIRALQQDIKEQKEIIEAELEIISNMEDQLKRHRINPGQTKAGQHALHRIAELILDGDMVSVHIGRSPGHGNLSRSSSSSASGSSTPSFRGPTAPRRPSGPPDTGGSGGPIQADLVSAMTPTVSLGSSHDPARSDDELQHGLSAVTDDSNKFLRKGKRRLPIQNTSVNKGDYFSCFDESPRPSVSVREPQLDSFSSSRTNMNKVWMASRRTPEFRGAQMLGESHKSQGWFKQEQLERGEREIRGGKSQEREEQEQEEREQEEREQEEREREEGEAREREKRRQQEREREEREREKRGREEREREERRRQERQRQERQREQERREQERREERRREEQRREEQQLEEQLREIFRRNRERGNKRGEDRDYQQVLR